MTRTTPRTIWHRERTPKRTEVAPPTPESSTLTPAQRSKYALAVHESAHAIAATILGHEVTTVTLTDATRSGSCAVVQRFGGPPSPEVAYAGPYAEQFFRHGGPPTGAAIRRALDGTDDFAAMTAAGDTRPAEIPRLIANCWASITYLANHLTINGAATQADVNRALHLPADDPDGRHHALAEIRSGSAPGSFNVVAPLP